MWVTMTACVLTVVLSGVGNTAAPGVRPGPVLCAPPAPFLSPKAASTKGAVAKPVVRANGVFFGDNGLLLDDAGNMTIVSGGKEVAKGLFGVWTAYGPNCMASNTGAFKNKRLTVARDKGKLLFQAAFPLDKQGMLGTYRQHVSLLPDGRLRLDIALAVPKGKEALLRAGHLMFKVPFVLCEGRRCTGDGKAYSFSNADAPKTKKSKVLFCSTRAKRLVFTPENPDTTFAMDFLCNRSVVVKENRLQTSWEGQKLYVDVGLAANRTIALVLDVRPIGPSSGHSADYHNGIDFWKCDRLHVPNYKLCRNLVQNPSFEAGLYHYTYALHAARYEDEQGRIYTTDTGEARFGNSSLLIRAVKGMTYPSGLATFAIPVVKGKRYTVSFFVKGDRPKLALNVGSISAVWPVFPLSANCTVTGEWTRQRFSFVAPNSGISVALRGTYHGDDPSGQGRIWVDGLQLEEGDMTDFAEKPLVAQLLTARPDDFFSPGQTIHARLRIIAKAHTAGRVAVQLEDYFYRTLWSGQYRFRTDAQGTARIPLPLDGRLPRGIFVLRADFELAGGFRDTSYFRLSVMDVLENKHRNKNLTSIALESRLPCAEAVFRRGRDIGIGSQTYITVPLSRRDSDRLRRFGMDFMGTAIVDDGNEGCIEVNGKVLVSGLWNLTQVTPELEKAVEEACYLKAKSMPWVDMWWFAGECEPRFRHATGSLVPDNIPDFAKLLKACYRGVKRFNRQTKVLAVGGPQNMNPQSGIRILDRYLAALGTDVRFDGVGIHPYRELPEDPDLDDDTAMLLRMMKKNGWANVPVYWNEGIYHHPYVIPAWGLSAHKGASVHCRIGPASYHMGWGERICAAYHARYWLVALKYQEYVKCFEAHWTLLFMDTSLAPFAVQKIPNTLGRLLGNARFRKDIRFAPNVRAYVFEDEQNRPVAALWSHIRRVDHGLERCPVASIRFSPALPEFIDLMEVRRRVVPEADGTCRVPVSPFPLFIRGRPGTLAGLCASLTAARLIDDSRSPVHISAKPAGSSHVEILFQNLLTHPFNGNATLSIQGRSTVKTLSLGAKRTARWRLPLSRPLSADRITTVTIPLQIKPTDGPAVRADVSFRGVSAGRRRGGPITIDGRLDDWRGVPAIPITNRYKWHTSSTQTGQEGDSQARFRVAWDEECLYLAVEVVDDKLVFTNGGGVNNWNNDSLQVYIDTFCDARFKPTRGFDMNDYNYDFCRNPEDKGKATPWRMVTPEEQLTGGGYALKNSRLEPNIKTAFRERAGGYVYEIAFPKRYVQPMALEPGNVVGFGLFVNDHDGERINNSLTLTPPGTSCYMNPHLWPAMVLVAESVAVRTRPNE